MKSLATVALGLALSTTSSVAQVAPAVGKGWICFNSKAEFSDAKVEAHDVRFNNFSFAEVNPLSRMRGASADLEDDRIDFTYSATNHGSQMAEIDVQLAGFDDNATLLLVAQAPQNTQQVWPDTTTTAEGGSVLEMSLLSQIRYFCISVRAVASPAGAPAGRYRGGPMSPVIRLN